MHRLDLPTQYLYEEKYAFNTIENYYHMIKQWALKKNSKELLSFLEKNIVSIDVLIVDVLNELQAPVSFLASQNLRDAVLFLLEHGANINYAIIGAKKNRHQELVSELQALGASSQCSEIGEHLATDRLNHYHDATPIPHLFKRVLNHIKYNQTESYYYFNLIAGLGGYFRWLDIKSMHPTVLFDTIIGAAAGGHYTYVDYLLDKLIKQQPDHKNEFLESTIKSYAKHGYLDTPALIKKLLLSIKDPFRRQHMASLADHRTQHIEIFSSFLYQWKNKVASMRPFSHTITSEDFLSDFLFLNRIKQEDLRWGGYVCTYKLLSVIENSSSYPNLSSYTRGIGYRISDFKPQTFHKLSVIMEKSKKQLAFQDEYKLPHQWHSEEVHGLLSMLITQLPTDVNSIIINYLILIPIVSIPKEVSYYFQKERILYDLTHKKGIFVTFIDCMNSFFHCKTSKRKKELEFEAKLEKSMPTNATQLYQLIEEGCSVYTGNKKQIVAQYTRLFPPTTNITVPLGPKQVHSDQKRHLPR